jgi:hypothetical protein
MVEQLLQELLTLALVFFCSRTATSLRHQSFAVATLAVHSRTVPDLPQSESRSGAIAAGYEEPVFTSMDVLLNGLCVFDGRFLIEKKGSRPLI